MNSNQLYAEALKWLNRKVKKANHSEITLKIIVYGGMISRVERSFVDKIQVANTGDETSLYDIIE